MPASFDGILERLLRANEEQAKGTGALVEIQRQNAERSREIEENTREQAVQMTRLATSMDSLVGQLTVMQKARLDDVEKINAHTTAALKETPLSPAYWKKGLIIAAVLLALAVAAGTSAKPLLDAFIKRVLG